VVLIEARLVGGLQAFTEFDIEYLEAEPAGGIALGQGFSQPNFIFS
jgi:hypothetical protein